MEKWQCTNCGYVLAAKKPPETCPSCNKKCEYKEVTDYVPKHIPRKERI